MSRINDEDQEDQENQGAYETPRDAPTIATWNFVFQNSQYIYNGDNIDDMQEDQFVDETTRDVATTTRSSGFQDEQEHQEEDQVAVIPTTSATGATMTRCSSFKDCLLKPELLLAIQEHGFEHPSEGLFLCLLDFTFLIVCPCMP